MKNRIAAVAFDIIETVFSLERLRERLVAAGLPPPTLETWFAQTLRDAFALEVTEVYKPFREVASATLQALLVEHGLPADGSRIDGVLDGFATLAPQPDAKAAFARLHAAGIRIVALTNGSAENTGKLLHDAGLKPFVEREIAVDGIGHWKPRQAVYLHAAESLDLAPAELALVAAHPWDIHGAGRAGLVTAFVARGKPFPATMMAPHITADRLEQAASQLVAVNG